MQEARLYETLRPQIDEIVVAGITENPGQKDDRIDPNRHYNGLYVVREKGAPGLRRHFGARVLQRGESG